MYEVNYCIHLLLPVATSACQQDCVDYAAGAFAANDAENAEGMGSWNPIRAWVFGVAHASAEAAITATYQICFGDCAV